MYIQKRKLDIEHIEDGLRMCQIRMARAYSYNDEGDFEFLITLRGNQSGDTPCPTCENPMYVRRIHGLRLDDLKVGEEFSGGSGYYAPRIVMFSCSRGHVWYRGNGYGWFEKEEE